MKITMPRAARTTASANHLPVREAIEILHVPDPRIESQRYPDGRRTPYEELAQPAFARPNPRAPGVRQVSPRPGISWRSPHRGWLARRLRQATGFGVALS